jgi:hypothetical protein
MKFEDAYAQLDELYGDAMGRFMVHRWLYTDETEVYHIVWTDKWGWFKINSDQVNAADLYSLLNCIRTTPGEFPYKEDHPDFWHVETPDSFLDYLRDHLTKKGRFKKCI